jgi:hypothetical protein
MSFGFVGVMLAGELLEQVMRGGSRALNHHAKVSDKPVFGAKININPLFFAMSLADTAKGVGEIGETAWNNALTNDPDGFRKLGEQGGMLGMDALFLGLTAHQSIRDTLGLRGQEVFRTGGAFRGKTFYRENGEMLERISRRGVAQGTGLSLAGAEAKAIIKGADKRYLLKSGMSTMRQTWKFDVGVTLGIMGVGILGSAALGAVGGIMDMANADSKSFKRIHYDTNYFDTRKQDMSSYDQIGAAMQNYSSRMQSVARIYHSR